MLCLIVSYRQTVSSAMAEKRKRPSSLTLWRAAGVKCASSTTLVPLADYFYMHERTHSSTHDDDGDGQICADDVRDLVNAKKRKCEAGQTDKEKKRLEHKSKLKANAKAARLRKTTKDIPQSSFTVAIKPTSHQKSVLDTLLRQYNVAYNWTHWLCDKKSAQLRELWRAKMKTKKPAMTDEEAAKVKRAGQDQYTIQAIVACQDRSKITHDLMVPADLAGGDTDWIFDGGASAVRLCGIKGYFSASKGSRGAKDFKDKDVAQRPFRGTFEVQSAYVRPLKEKDVAKLPVSATQKDDLLAKGIAMMPENFAGRSKVNPEKFLLLSKKVTSIPPLDYDMKVTKLPGSVYRLHIPCALRWTRNLGVDGEKEPSNAICAADPGVRTFMTVYDPTRKRILEVGYKNSWVAKRLARVGGLIDKVKALHLEACGGASGKVKEREARRRQLCKLGVRRKNIVKAVHIETARFFVTQHAIVALGDLGSGVKSCVKKGGRLNQKTKTEMLRWGHAMFRDRLISRARHTPCDVTVQDEYNTSQYCGVCYQKNRRLGSSKVFKCPSCGYDTDRDINGARNIMQLFLGIGKIQPRPPPLVVARPAST